jgi:hypothetical protein
MPVTVVKSVSQGNPIGNMRNTLTELVNNDSPTAQHILAGSEATAAIGTAVMLIGNKATTGFGIAAGDTFYCRWGGYDHPSKRWSV